MIRKLLRLLLLSFLSLLTLYILLLSFVSISMGVINTDRPGFWMPILSGLLVLWLSIYIIRLIIYIAGQSKVKERYPSD
jgi:predicted tellurium resistance membrane protein TerC